MEREGKFGRRWTKLRGSKLTFKSQIKTSAVLVKHNNFGQTDIEDKRTALHYASRESNVEVMNYVKRVA